MLPSRHTYRVREITTLPPLPEGQEWGGDIAFLDRDGVLNIGSEEYIKTPEELVILEGSADAVARIREAGYRVCIVTNQSPVGRGIFSHKMLEQIHIKLEQELVQQNPNALLDLILYSPYVPWAGAWARKGNPGMLQVGRQLLEACECNSQISEFDYGTDYTARDEGTSFMVGDRPADMKAGSRHDVRVFHCDPDIGICDVLDRVLDTSDQGDMV